MQVLKVIPTMWSQWASESSSLSPLVKSIVLNMSLLSRSSHAAIDPSNSPLSILTIKRENASRKQDGSMGFFDDLSKTLFGNMQQQEVKYFALLIPEQEE